MRVSAKNLGWLVSNQSRTRGERAAIALLIGLAITVVGVPLFFASQVAADTAATASAGTATAQFMIILTMGIVFALMGATPVFGVAAAGWWLLDRLGLRSPAAAVAYGAAVAAVFSLAIHRHPSPVLMLLSAALGGLIWILAYRRVRPAA